MSGLDFTLAVTERHDGSGGRWFVCKAQLARAKTGYGMPVILTAESQSRTRAGAMAHAFEALARGLEQEHHDERRDA